MKEEVTFNTQQISVQLRNMEGGKKGDHWPLATLEGGIDKLTVKQRQTKTGLKTTIEFVTEGGSLVASDYDARQRRRQVDAHRFMKADAEKLGLG